MLIAHFARVVDDAGVDSMRGAALLSRRASATACNRGAQAGAADAERSVATG